MNEIVKANAGTIVRNSFSEQSIAATGATISDVLSAQAKAETEARFIVAMKRPRDWDEVRVKLLKACERPGFAGLASEKQKIGDAWYKKPIGKGKFVEGFSVRFAEEALRCMGNMDAKTTVLWEDNLKRLINVEVIDLENNIAIPTMIVLEKTVERRYLRKGEVALSTRVNSNNEPVYLREATEEEALQKQSAMVSKAIRNGILRLLPGDLQAECRDRIIAIRVKNISPENPDGVRKKISDGFSKCGVSPAELKRYLGHELNSCSPAELSALRDIYTAIMDGSTTWKEVIDEPEVDETEKKQPKTLRDVVKDVKNKTTEPTATKKEEKTEEKEDATGRTERQSFPATEDLVELARKIWGKDAIPRLQDACQRNGCKLDRLSESEFSGMLDTLQSMID